MSTLHSRLLLNNLVHWKNKSTRKPLIIRGARQVGKTTLIRDFSKKYKQSIYLNLEKQEHKAYFENSDDVKTIIEVIFISNNKNLDDLSDTLLFIDEIQELPKAIHLLRYFYEETPTLQVIGAGSLLEFALKEISSFPVGRVEFMYLHPFNFIEFLMATGEDLILNLLAQVPVKETAHDKLLDLFNRYTIMGGMPEVVKVYAQNNSVAELIPIYESIWSSYVSDTEKYAKGNTSRNVIKHIMKTAPFFIDKRVKYQNFGNSNYKSREVSEAMKSLDQAKIIQLIYPTTSIEAPIISDFKKSPRLQFLDTGLVNYTLNIIPDMLTLKDLSNAYKGSIIPHVFTQEVISNLSNTFSLPHFWVREKSQSSSEVDLVISHEGKLIPIEIKSGSTGTLKSLHQFMDRANHSFAVRVYGGKFEIQKTKTTQGKEFLLMNLPYYLGTKLTEYLNFFTKNHTL